MKRPQALTPHLSRRTRIGLGAAVLLGLGAAGGAGAVSLIRPGVEMAPTVPTAIVRLPQSDGVVTVRGRVVEVFGDRFVVQDPTGRTMVNAGRAGRGAVSTGSAITVQGRYDDGQLRASYLVDPDGGIKAVGPAGRPPHGPGRPDRDGPPPPPQGCASAPGATLSPPVSGATAQSAAAPIPAPMPR